MGHRVNIQQTHPEVYKAMLALAGSLNHSTLSPIQKHLIKVRASQINACAFCIDMHTKEALKVGETQQRIFLLNAWRETDIFTQEEKVILALTEEVTLIHKNGISDDTYRQAEKYFSAQTIGDIIAAAISINGLNRLAISTQIGKQIKLSHENIAHIPAVSQQ